ncbi:MAG: CoA transferase [Salinibacterium sp.]|nr:CoA transferase [Salinibacterium sp.]
MNFLATAWSSLGEDPAALDLVRPHEVPLDSVLPVAALVHDAVAAASLSAALLLARRADSAVPPVELDPVRVATAVTSERHYRLAGEPMNAWAELSGFWPTADGWVRTHANYPHHRDRLLGALGLPNETTADELLRHLHGRNALEVEEVVAAGGGVAIAVRTEAQWREHEQFAAVARSPLVSVERIGDAPELELAAADAPATGIRILDFTRVIAGPVATRTLALWGADVLRVDGPDHPEIPAQHLDTGAGKRSVILDLAADRDVVESLLADAHVVVTGYRPGALDRFGLSPEALVERHPGLVVARLSAWGTTGPFAVRRGFDSIVQAASGIGWIESPDAAKPGALPAQALDHSAGYLLAAAITSALRRRLDEGGSWLVETSLARVAQELLDAPRSPWIGHPSWEPTVGTHDELTTALPAPHYDGGPGEWPSPVVAWGSSEPRWK